MTDTVWIVYRDGEPTTAHASEDGAREAADIALARDYVSRYSIRTATLAPLQQVGAERMTFLRGATCGTCWKSFDPDNAQDVAYHQGHAAAFTPRYGP